MKQTSLELIIKRDSADAASRAMDDVGARGERAAKRVQAAFGAADRAAMQHAREWQQVRSAIVTVEQAIEREMATARRAMQTNNGLADSFKKMKDAAAQSQANGMASMIQASDPFQRQATALDNVAAAAGRAGPGLNALREPLTNATRLMLGLNPAVAQVTSVLGAFALGAPWMIGVLAGVAALAFAWDRVSTSARKAKEEQASGRMILEGIRTQNRNPVLGGLPAAMTAEETRLQDLLAKRTELLRKAAETDNGVSAAKYRKEAAALVNSITDSKNLIQHGNREITRLNKEHADRLAAEEQRRRDARKAADEAWYRDWIAGTKKAADDLARARGVVGTTGAIGADAAARTSAREAAERAARRSAHDERFQAQLKEFEQEARDHQQRMENIAKEAAARKKALQDSLIQSGLQLVGGVGGAKGGLIASTIQSGIQAAAATGGNPIAIAAASLVTLTVGIFNMGKAAREAAERLAAAQRDFQASFAFYRKGSTGALTDTDRAIEAERQQYQNYIKQIEELYAGKKHEAERNRLLAQAKTAHDAYIAQIHGTAAAMEKAAKADGFRTSIEQFTAVIDNLKSFRGELSLSQLSPLTPVQRLAEARRQYEEILGKARAGDVTAANQLPQFARIFLEASREVYGSSATYQRDYQRVMLDTDEIAKMFESQRAIAQQQLDVLLGIRAGSAAAADQAHRDAEAVRKAVEELIEETRRSTDTPAEL